MVSQYIWVNYNNLTATSLEMMVNNQGNHPQMALIQTSELISFTQNGDLSNQHGFKTAKMVI